MKSKVEKQFKAVEFMGKIREDLSALYNTDKRRYFKEIKKAKKDFDTHKG